MFLVGLFRMTFALRTWVLGHKHNYFEDQWLNLGRQLPFCLCPEVSKSGCMEITNVGEDRRLHPSHVVFSRWVPSGPWLTSSAMMCIITVSMEFMSTCVHSTETPRSAWGMLSVSGASMTLDCWGLSWGQRNAFSRRAASFVCFDQTWLGRYY